jgi:intracellular sulfur oxidation DsrE/DsrF family protein
VDLPPTSIDVAFVCDTYHHFEFPEKTMRSIHRALKPGGRVIVIDFHRIPGTSSDWVLNHVRAGQDVVEKEIASCGFKKTDEVKELLKENYFAEFTKAAREEVPPAKGPKMVTPVIPGYGAVVPYPAAQEQPVKGSKVVFDVTATAKDPDQPLPGLVRAATLLNLAGASGLKASDLELVVVLHGDATSAALDDAAYKELTGREHPHADLMKKLKGAGVKVLVCGQALARKGYEPKQVRGEVVVAASAVTAVANLQARGFAYIPAH